MENDLMIDPLIIEVYLYKSNYKDRLLIGELKERAQLISMPSDSSNQFFVKVEEVIEILQAKFIKDLIDFDSTPKDQIGSTVTSVYFLDHIIWKYPTLKYFKISVNDSSIYSRKIDDMINFGSKIIHARVDIPAIYDERDYQKVRSIFSMAGLVNRKLFEHIPYIEIETDELIKVLDYSLHKNDIDVDSEEFSTTESIKSMLGERVIKDNPNLLIVIDK